MDLSAVREQFPITRTYAFLNAAAVAPMSGPAAEAMKRYAEEMAEQSTLGGGLYETAERVRVLAARLIQARPAEVTFVKNTTEGIGWVAEGLSWQPGDNVVISAVEFPANVYPWMGLRDRGVELRMVPEDHGRIPTESVLAVMDDRTRVLSLSAVQFASGFRADLAGLGRACRERGILFCVDAIQALGVLPVDVRAMGIDFLSADGHKWLCGPEGCGLFYCAAERLETLRPLMAGWLCMEDALNFGDYRFEFLRSARRFDSGSYNLAGIHALGASLDLLMDVGIDRIAAHVLGLTDRLVAGVRKKGYRVISSRQEGEASGIVAFVSDRHDHEQIRRTLQDEHHIIIACREGRLRVSPHLYNTAEEIERLVDLLPGH